MESHSTLEANSTNPTPTYQPRHSVSLTISIQNGSHEKPWYSAQPWEPLSWRLRNYDSRSHNYRQVSLTDTAIIEVAINITLLSHTCYLHLITANHHRYCTITLSSYWISLIKEKIWSSRSTPPPLYSLSSSTSYFPIPLPRLPP